MNEVFLIGKLIENVEYKFMLEKRKNSQSNSKTRIIRQDKIRSYSIQRNSRLLCKKYNKKRK